MSTCPKCSFALAPGAAECPACGVILAKVRPRAGAGSAVSPPSPAPPRPEPEPPEPYVPGAVYSPAAAFSDGDLITSKTLQALGTARPWLRFLVGYGFVTLVLMILGAILLLLVGPPGTGGDRAGLALVYFLYALVMIALLLPLKRSTDAIRGIHLHGATSGLEAFVTEQAVFWRRAGILTAVSLVLVGIGILFIIAGVLGP